MAQPAAVVIVVQYPAVHVLLSPSTRPAEQAIANLILMSGETMQLCVIVETNVSTSNKSICLGSSSPWRFYIMSWTRSARVLPKGMNAVSLSPLYCPWDDPELVEERLFAGPFTPRQVSHSRPRRRSYTRRVELAEDPFAVQKGRGKLVVGLDAQDVTNLWDLAERGGRREANEVSPGFAQHLKACP